MPVCLPVRLISSGESAGVGRGVVILKRRFWARRVGFFFGGVLGVVVLFLLVVPVLNITISGVEPEGLVLAFMMTAPFTLGFILVSVLGAAGAERVTRRGRARGP